MAKENTFYLGLTMAGAVSAGCYTAGVMDYLFEVLDLWERAKRGEVAGVDEKLVPKHNVVIDAMGGASAGGMATIMTSIYALQGKVNPVKEVPENPRDNFNILYDSWVHLDDDAKSGKLSFEKIWDTDDLAGADAKVRALFNTKVIDHIAGKAFTFANEYELKQQADKLPAYISKDLEVLLSHALLRGIPLTVGFNVLGKTKRRTDSPEHTTFEHYLVSHFKLNKGEAVDQDKYLWLNPFIKEHADRMCLSTISTGAFPIGLRFRKFDKSQFSDEYIKSVTRRLVFGNFGVDDPSKDNGVNVKMDFKEEDFASITIDGGAINNEPYREVASILKARHEAKDKENGYQNYGMIMIDPFPNDYKVAKANSDVNDILGVVPKIIGTLLDQSRVKRQEIIDQFATDYYRGIIYPAKREGFKKLEYPIACASFQAFGGFLDINFRVHDFFLGRDNARNYIRQYFGMPYDPENGVVHPIHKNWTPEAVERFVIKRREGNYLPVIPDLNMVLDGVTDPKAGWNEYTISSKPSYKPENLMRLRPKIEARFTKIFDVLEAQLLSEVKEAPKPAGEAPANPLTAKWMATLKRSGGLNRFLGQLFNPVTRSAKRLFLRRAKKEIVQRLTNGTLETILKDLEDKGLIRED